MFEIFLFLWWLCLSSLHYLHATLMSLPIEQWVQTLFMFDNVVTPMICDWKITSTNTEVWNGFNLIQVVNDFYIQKRAIRCVLQYLCSENSHKIHHKASTVELKFWIPYSHAKFVFSNRWFFRISEQIHWRSHLDVWFFISFCTASHRKHTCSFFRWLSQLFFISMWKGLLFLTHFLLNILLAVCCVM